MWHQDAMGKKVSKGAAYERHRKTMARRQREARAEAAEIGQIPDVVDPERRESCRENLRLFCETYRSQAFNLAWSDDHLRILQRIQATVTDGGLFGLAMPRGSGKTTLTITAAIWALLYGHRSWVCLIGSTGPKAANLLKAIKTELRFNGGFLEDFPEVCYPIMKLEGRSARAQGQTCDGKETSITWKTDQLVLPTIEGSKASGGVISIAGITGDIRGQQSTLPDGRVIRPDYVILDDPQTRESAKSQTQTEDRLAIVNGDVLGLAGPNTRISGVMPCTVIQRGDLADQILDRDVAPDWHGERTQLLYGMPTNMKLWDEYQEIRERDFRNDGDGSKANEYYERNRTEMDKGARAAWPERKLEGDLSAIQYAMNLFLRDEASFYAEYQNEPIESIDDDTLTLDQISERVNGFKRGIVSNEAEFLTGMIDVQKEILYWVVCAWKTDFTGWIVDYGSFPDQKTTNFRLSSARRTLGKAGLGKSLEAIHAKAYLELTNQLCGMKWARDDGAEMSLDRLFIDANWGKTRDLIYRFCRNSQYRSVIYPCHGRFIGAGSEPLNAKHVSKSRGKTIGTHWRLAKSRDTPVRHYLFDANYWKSFLHSRFATEPGSAGSLTLYNASPRTHRTIASHCKAEYAVRTEGRGREVDEWKLRADRPDNHWFDCLVGCAAAASYENIPLPGAEATRSSRTRKRYTQADLKRN